MPRPNTGPRLKPLRDSRTGRVSYVARWTDPDTGERRKHSFGVIPAEAARRAFSKWLEGWHRARNPGPRGQSEITLERVLRDYAERHGEAVAAPGSLAYAIEPLVAFFSGAAAKADPAPPGEEGWPRKPQTVGDLTFDLCKDYWDWRRDWTVRLPPGALQLSKEERAEVRPVIVPGGVADGTIIRELAGVLRPALKHAIGNKLMVAPAPLVAVPSMPAGRDLWLTRSEAARLLWAARKDPRSKRHLQLFIVLVLYSGPRKGAALDLTWPMLDFLRPKIDFNPPGRQQTAKKRPIVPMHRKLEGHLRRAHRRSNSAHVISYLGEAVGDIKKAFNSAAERAGVPEATAHTLRHTCGTWMAHGGAPLREIAGMLGHSEKRTTELYAHHHPDYLSKAMAALD